MKERNNKQSEHNQGYKKNWENCKYFVNNNGGLTQQDVKKKRTAKRLCVTSMTDCMCCYILHLILLCSDLLQKDLLQAMQHLAAIVSGAPNENFRKNICSEDDLRSRIFGTLFCCKISCLPASPRIFKHLKNGKITHFQWIFTLKRSPKIFRSLFSGWNFRTGKFWSL